MVRAFGVSAFLLTILLAASARAASQQENVTVTASPEVIAGFARAFPRPATMTGKIPRWETGICPMAVGQPPAMTGFVTARVQVIAAATGAPVNESKSCTPNIEIIFTTAPQDLLDNIRKKSPDYLGYAESNSLKDKLATVSHPIQAWYATETVDLAGMRRVDSARRLGTGSTMRNFTGGSSMMGNRDAFNLPDATYARVTGNHINDGTRSAFNHIIIAVDSSKLAGRDFVPLADYIAMLALTQPDSLDACQQLPTVVNVMAPNCDQRVGGITAVDLSYLKGLYRMAPDKSLVFQEAEIANQMKQSLEGQWVLAAPRDRQ